MALTTVEIDERRLQIDERRLQIQEAAEARAKLEHESLMTERAQVIEERRLRLLDMHERLLAYHREVAAQEKQAEHNSRIADGLAWSNRIAVLLDASIKRIDDRTSATGAVNIPKAVKESIDTVAEIERQLILPVPVGGGLAG